MIVHDLKRGPKNYDHYGNIEPLDSYGLRELEEQGIDEIWYWYADGGYEGCGQILIRKGDLFDIHDASHCSCYGATDGLEFKGKPLMHLYSDYSMNQELLREVEDLFEMTGLKYK